MSHRFDPSEGLIVVPTRIWGPAGDSIARLALDTGATRSIVSWPQALLLGYDPAAGSERIQITTGSGVEYVPPIRLLRVEALGRIHEGLSFLCHTLPASATVDGVLGLDFMRGHRLVVDFVRGEVILGA